MFSTFLFSFRESFEAWLVVGIIITYLKTAGCKQLLKPAYIGATVGVILSFVIGVITFSEANTLSKNGRDIFEGMMMLLSAGLVGYFIVWMSGRNRQIAAKVACQIKNRTTGLGIFILALFAVLREGTELTVFVLTKVQDDPAKMLSATIAGMLLSLAVTFFVFLAASQYLLKYIFKFLGALLIYFGAEMFSEGILKFLPLNGEEWEMVLAVLFALPAVYIFFKEDIRKFLKNKK